MIRGTTPRLDFVLPLETDIISDAYVTISQRHKTVVEKTLDKCNCDGNVLSTVLTQTETLALDVNTLAEIQIRIKTSAGEALASDIFTVEVKRILKDGEI